MTDAAILTGTESRLQGPRSVAREQAILDAALVLVVEVGYDRLSMDALAERARASKATIYRHWTGKAEVVAAAVRARNCEVLVAPDTSSLRGDLVAQLSAMCQSMNDEDGALILGVLRAMRGDPELARLMRAQVLESKRTAFSSIIERAVARGELTAAGATEADAAGQVMESMVFMRLLVTGEPLDDDFVTHLVDDILIPLLRR